MLEGLLRVAEYYLKVLVVNIVYGISAALWWVQKLAGWLADTVIASDVWETLTISLMGSLEATMPDTLETLLLGSGSLLYLAIIAIALTMIIPMVSRKGSRASELPRILAWAVLVTALFISSVAGYDLIAQIETQRMALVADLASGWSGGNVSALVATPMSATAAEIDVNSFGLPATFESEYFPAPSDFETVDIVFYDSQLLGSYTAQVQLETASGISARQEAAQMGILLAALNLIPAVILLILLAIFVILAATAIMLIIFFLVAAPLGVFEVGEVLLGQIGARYALIWVLSLLAAFFPGVLLSVSELTITPPLTLEDLLLYIMLLLIAAYAISHILQWSINVGSESFRIIGSSINEALAVTGMASGRTMPVPAALPPGYATGAVAGGLATMGGAGLAAQYGLGVGLAALGAGTVGAAAGLSYGTYAAAGAIARRQAGQGGGRNGVTLGPPPSNHVFNAPKLLGDGGGTIQMPAARSGNGNMSSSVAQDSAKPVTYAQNGSAAQPGANREGNRPAGEKHYQLLREYGHQGEMSGLTVAAALALVEQYRQEGRARRPAAQPAAQMSDADWLAQTHETDAPRRQATQTQEERATTPVAPTERQREELLKLGVKDVQVEAMTAAEANRVLRLHEQRQGVAPTAAEIEQLLAQQEARVVQQLSRQPDSPPAQPERSMPSDAGLRPQNKETDVVTPEHEERAFVGEGQPRLQQMPPEPDAPLPPAGSRPADEGRQQAERIIRELGEKIEQESGEDA